MPSQMAPPASGAHGTCPACHTLDTPLPRTLGDVNPSTDTSNGKTLLLPYTRRIIIFFGVHTNFGAHASIKYRLFPPRIKRLGREANRSLPSSAEVTHAWPYIPTPPHVFMASRLVKHRDFYLVTAIIYQLSLERSDSGHYVGNPCRLYFRTTISYVHTSPYFEDVSHIPQEQISHS
jgi:hypothetical protein